MRQRNVDLRVDVVRPLKELLHRLQSEIWLRMLVVPDTVRRSRLRSSGRGDRDQDDRLGREWMRHVEIPFKFKTLHARSRRIGISVHQQIRHSYPIARRNRSIGFVDL